MAEISVALPQSALPSIWSPKSRLDVWSSIQIERQSGGAQYVHPLIRRSSSLMSQKSLEICTEGLGSETGSDGFSSADEFDFLSPPPASPQEAVAEDAWEAEVCEVESGEDTKGRRELPAVNYHCSIGCRWPPKSFPPPLPSISRRDGPCIKIRTLRRDGRLLAEAVPVPSQTYLHAERHEGRLLLSFINSPPSSPPPPPPISRNEEEVDEDELEDYDDDDEYEEEEEEVEVVDRGSIVEVKVSGLAAVSRVHRSSLVINKFVVGSPLTAADVVCASTTTAAAAAVAASSISAPASTSEGFHYNYLHRHQDTLWGLQSPSAEAKLLFASKRRRREKLLHDVRRCSELRLPLFIFEQPHCIATSS